MADKNLPEIELATAMLELVRSTDVGGTSGDTAGAVMLGAYVRAYRRFAHIRDLARDGAGEEAFILARSLLSMTARAIWVDLPADRAERQRRFDSWKKRELQDELDSANGLAAVGIDANADIEELRQERSDLADVRKIPDDRRLLETLGLGVHYQRLYRPSSSYAHFSLHQAIDEVRSAAEAGEDLPFDRAEPEVAKEALALSILTYGLFIEMSEKAVRHNLGERMLDLVRASPVFG